MRFFCCFIFLFLSFKSFSFCGFYVAKGDASLFNKASQVVLVRHEDKTVISMMNDYEGPFKNFALVVPVPSVLKKEQVNVGDKKLFERIDAFTAPRLVEYFDKDPCANPPVYMEQAVLKSAVGPKAISQSNQALGVMVEEKFTVGEYDIVILSAQESKGLETWLRMHDYTIPKGAHKALAPYIKQKMKFFVAKVNLEKQIATGLSFLRPLQFAFESEKFMLPIRLGMINAQGPQDLFVYVLSRSGRVETANYRTVKIPTDMELPVYIKNEFSSFYKSLFETQVEKEKMKTVFMEYFWDMGWCDPCAADPLSKKELEQLGVFWLNEERTEKDRPSSRWGSTGALPVKVTRLHLRYTNKTFPEDLMFYETGDTKNFQGRYVLRHPWLDKKSTFSDQRMKKEDIRSCDRKRKRYFEDLAKYREKRAQNLAFLTGWDIHSIREKMGDIPQADEKENSSNDDKKSFWQRLWPDRK